MAKIKKGKGKMMDVIYIFFLLHEILFKLTLQSPPDPPLIQRPLVPTAFPHRYYLSGSQKEIKISIPLLEFYNLQSKGHRH